MQTVQQNQEEQKKTETQAGENTAAAQATAAEAETAQQAAAPEQGTAAGTEQTAKAQAQDAASAQAQAPELPDEEAPADKAEADKAQDMDPQLVIAAMRAKVESMEAQVKQSREQMLRVMAEADNVRKRAANDMERARKFALEGFVKALIPVADAMEQALKAVEKMDGTDGAAVKATTVEGVDNTLKLFLKEMSSFGVECTNPVGQPFDPNTQQAITMVPTAAVKPNHVLDVMQKGFLLNGRVVRPAMVVVAKAPE